MGFNEDLNLQVVVGRAGGIGMAGMWKKKVHVNGNASDRAKDSHSIMQDGVGGGQ